MINQAKEHTYNVALNVMLKDSTHFVVRRDHERILSCHKSPMDGKRLLNALGSPGYRMITKEYIEFLAKRK